MVLETTAILIICDDNPRASSCWTHGPGRTDVVAATGHGFFAAFAVVSDGIVVKIAAGTDVGDSTVSMAMADADVMIESAGTAVAVPCSAAPTESAIAAASSIAGFLAASAADVVIFADFAAVSSHALCFQLAFQPYFASPSNSSGSTISTAIVHHIPRAVQHSESSIAPLDDRRVRRQNSSDKHSLSLN